MFTAAQIARHGIDANVYNHSLEEAVVGEIVQRYQAGDHGPYILVGHSLGADAVMVMAQQLNARDVPVALVVPFDGTASFAASKNVACVINVTQRRFAYMQPGPGFFDLAKKRGRNTSDILKCWIAELKKVHGAWAPTGR